MNGYGRIAEHRFRASCGDGHKLRLAGLRIGYARDWFARKPTRLDKLGAAGGVMMVGLGATMLASE